MLHGSQKRFDKNGDGKLSMREWNRWYYYTIGADEDARKRRAAHAAAEQKRAEIAGNFADHAADIINWMYHDLEHLEGEREDQAIRTMHLALYVISTALQTQAMDDSLRYLLRAFWREFQPTLGESVYQGLCAKQLIFEEIGVIRRDRLGSFWMELLYGLPPERRVGKDADLQELLDDTSRLYNYFRNDDTPEMDYAAAIEPYWAKIRLPEESEESDEDEDAEAEPEEESKLWTDFYEKPEPVDGGFYTFCMVQFTENGTSYAYLTGGISLKARDFVIVSVGKCDKERLGRVTEVFVCAAQDAPYPPEKTKFVLRKADQTSFPEKKPAKKEAQPAQVQTAKKEPTSTPPAAETPVPAQPVVESPAVEQPKPEGPETAPGLEPSKEKRRVPWGWLIAAAAIAAFVIFALSSLKRTAEAQRQKVIALQAEQQAEREREVKRAEEQGLEKEAESAKHAAEDAAKREQRLKEQYSGKLPVDGMPVSCLQYTSIGAPTKTEKCQFYDNMDVNRRYKILRWYNSEGQIVASCHAHQPKGAAQETIYDFTYYENPIGRPNSAPAWTPPSTSSSSNSSSIRDDYDNPEDLYEDNRDWYDDEDEAWDEWENG